MRGELQARTLPVLRTQSSRTTSPTEVPFDASLWRQEGQRLRCLACARGCVLGSGDLGFCTAVMNRNGALHSTAYGVIGEASVTPIENKPVYHYLPGARVLSLGGIGCNLRCKFCQNYELAFRSANGGGGVAAPNLLPEHAIAAALERQAEGIGWSHNEPTISPMYMRDCARLARAAGLFTVVATNGLLTHEALDFLGPWLDVYRVDVKSLDRGFYERVGGTNRIDDMLPIASRAQREFGIHVEIVTNLMPGFNDSDEHAQRLAARLVRELGADTPYHLTSFVPYAFMLDVPPTPPETLQRVKSIAHKAGLRFVYTDSLVVPGDASTRCPNCEALLIERRAGAVYLRGLDERGGCGACGAELGIVTRQTRQSRTVYH